MAEHTQRLYSSIDAEDALEALRLDGREEDLYLEFKQKQDSRNGDVGESDRRSFSKALSGFANADGGVLVFGIETARTRDGIDRAHALKPFQNPEHFRARLLDSVLNSTQPVVDDIEAKAIPSAGGGGYVICHIPQSVRAPHRAMLAEHQYWRRTATGHRRMDHYELADFFGRRLRPSVAFFNELRRHGDNEHLEEVHFLCLNEGRGVARHFGFLWKPVGADIRSALGSGLHDVSKMNARAAVTHYDAHLVLHPNGIYFNAGSVIIYRANRDAPLEVEATWYAEDMETKRGAAALALDTRVKVGG